MRKINLVGLMCLWPIAATPADKFQPLNVKTGLWESSSTMIEEGEPAGKAVSSKHCITQEQVDNAQQALEPWARAGSKGRQGTTVTIVKSTSSELLIHLDASGSGVNGSGDVHIQVISPVEVTADSHSELTFMGKTVKMKSEIRDRWIGPNCGSVE